ncbi:methyltransferase domain-containing protein [Coleofasciculus sp. FACHB-T130]|uniref:class I SAM-dependent methyltransferase n=1 Tax=Cyanophyceae TaxID=3028117 RepID=UPI0016880011|nr:methyltransferase domain-containing protein [Coleofasciculus sp. FACHB-T130]MBD1878300.1 class I SAM-dependent methyltransferase [Coleofasciculus sp. FACHB-T130]
MNTVKSLIKIDIGCGPHKREGFIGIDSSKHSGVDYVVDIEKEDLPFENGSVDYIFSSHCLEHISNTNRFFQEICRVACEGATVEIWTPYAFSNGAFIFSHVQFLNEEHYMHMCVLFPEVYKKLTGGFWVLNEIKYVVLPSTLVDIDRSGHSLDFALKYFKGVVQEFGVFMNIYRSKPPKEKVPAWWEVRTFSTDRYEKSMRIKELAPSTDEEVSKAIKKFALDG